MKKSNIVIAAGCFIVVTALLCINPSGKLYVKQQNFTTPEQVLEQLEKNSIRAKNERGNFEETNEFKECISKRKRLTDSQFGFYEMSIEKVVELTDKEKETILKNYKEMKSYIPKSGEYDNAQVRRVITNLDGTYYGYTEGDCKREYDFVFIDEGEGLVIDYVVERTVDETTEEKGDINVKG